MLRTDAAETLGIVPERYEGRCRVRSVFVAAPAERLQALAGGYYRFSVDPVVWSGLLGAIPLVLSSDRVAVDRGY